MVYEKPVLCDLRQRRQQYQFLCLSILLMFAFSRSCADVDLCLEIQNQV